MNLKENSITIESGERYIFLFDTYAFFEILKGSKNYEKYKDANIITTKLNIFELYLKILRESNQENANKLLRKHFPKGSDLSTISPQKLAAVVKILNNTPRKNLGWKTPHEVMLQKNLYKNKKSR